MLWKGNNGPLSVGVWENLDSQKFIDQILGIESVLPDGWLTGTSIEYHPSKTIAEGLEDPDVVIVFVNRDTTFMNTDQQVSQHPSLVLNFFDISRIEQIDSIMRRHISFTGCGAVPYDTTADYFILSSKCLQNHGFYSTEANSLVAPLHNSLHTYFDELK